MAKRDSMQETVEETEAGEQMPLIDELTEQTKPIVPVARAYHKIIRQRLAIQKKEAELLTKLRETTRKSGLLPLEDGRIVFHWQDVKVVVTPQDDKVKVTIKEE